MQSLATHFRYIITSLQAALAVVVTRDRARTDFLLFALWPRIGRMATRFERLFTSWGAGIVPTPRASRAGQPRAAKPRAKSPFPTRRAWLIASAREATAAHGQLAYFLARPDLADFLAAVPQAGRILRPLCHMLSVDLTLPGDRPPRPPRPYQPPIKRPQFRVPKPAPKWRRAATEIDTPDRPPPFPPFCFRRP